MIVQDKPISIANVARVEIITEEDTPRAMMIETMNDVGIDAFVSEGSSTEQRVKNTIYAQNNTETIVKGYDISLSDVRFSPAVFALVDGGTVTLSENGEPLGYSAPVAGAVVRRTKFRIAIYSEIKDYAGDTLGYVRYEFPHAYGSPCSYALKDGEFYTSSYKCKSVPAQGEAPMTIALNVPALPAYVTSAEECDSADVGDVICLLSTLTISGEEHTVASLLLKTEDGWQKIN